MPGIPYAPQTLYQPGHTIGELLAQRGAVSGQAWQQVGQTVAGTIGAILQQKQQEKVMAQEQQMRQIQLGQVQQQQAAAARAQQEDAALKGLKAFTPETVFPIVGPERGAKILAGLAAVQSAQQKQYSETHTVIRDTLSGMAALPEQTRASLYPAIRSALIDGQVITPKDAPESYDPAWFQQAVTYGQQAAKAPGPVTVAPGATVYDPVQEKALYTAPAAERAPSNPTEASLAAEAAKGNPDAIKALAVLRAQHPPSETVSTDQANAHDIALAIARGDQPPTVTGLYRMAGPVRAELAKMGYDMSRANLDWQATQKHLSTLNNAQQTRLNQSINALPDLLESVDTLASQWKGGRFPVLNKANLALAKNGAYGSEVASVARQLDSQIADVTADLGNVYMGGNTPTDQALGLASKALAGEWDEKVLHDMVTRAKANVVIRLNSIRSVGVQGASASNPYAPPVAPAAPAAPTSPLGSYEDYLKRKGQ